jgi:hypothetical protein
MSASVRSMRERQSHLVRTLEVEADRALAATRDVEIRVDAETELARLHAGEPQHVH